MRSYSRLTHENRSTIEAMVRSNFSQSTIAKTLGVSPSTISREIRRAGMKPNNYSCRKAQRHADSMPRHGVRMAADVLLLVEEKLINEQWSPQQISETFKREGIARISHETIYQHIYRDKQNKGSLHIHLRHKCRSYRKRSSGRERRGRLKDQVFIDDRPPEAEARQRIGDWEVDTVLGKKSGPVLVTMVERTSRFTLVGQAPSKEALEVAATMLRMTSQHRDKVLTTTYDNGKEFAHHALLADIIGAGAYFAHPYRAWERGLNENTNGLIRQYFPKGCDLSKITEEDVLKVQNKLNSRPRKCLDYRTPNDIYYNSGSVALAS